MAEFRRRSRSSITLTTARLATRLLDMTDDEVALDRLEVPSVPLALLPPASHAANVGQL